MSYWLGAAKDCLGLACLKRSLMLMRISTFLVKPYLICMLSADLRCVDNCGQFSS